MRSNNYLEKIGIYPKNKLKLGDKNYLAKNIANMLSQSFNELSNDYIELYMRIYNCNMYYADVNEKFRGVFYYYKNNTIYIDSKKDISKIDEYLIHEVIHYLQNFSKLDNNRAGVCKLNEFTIFGLGINEAIVQYIIAKALNEEFSKINYEKVSIYTYNNLNYKYLSSLIYQILFLIGEKEAIKSSIYSTEDFENQLYYVFEENTNKILKYFDYILENNYKLNDARVINAYMKAQELIYKTYFTKMYKRLSTLEEIDKEEEKLKRYSNIVGIRNDSQNEYNKFLDFKKLMINNYIKKYVSISKQQSKNSLIVYKSGFSNFWKKIVKLLNKTDNEKVNN